MGICSYLCRLCHFWGRQINRALLGWSQSDLARRSGVSEPTIARLESVDGQLGGREETVRKIRTALENSGIEFTDENGSPRGAATRAASEKTVGLLAPRCTPKITKTNPFGRPLDQTVPCSN